MQGRPPSGHKIQTILNKTCKIIIIIYIHLYCYVLKEIMFFATMTKCPPWLYQLLLSYNTTSFPMCT